MIMSAMSIKDIEKSLPTIPPSSELGCSKEPWVNLSAYILDHPLRPLASITQSFSELDEPPGKRYSIPMTAIGMTPLSGLSG